MDFRGAPLNLVLDYLSDAAGFIINKETDVRGTVDVWSKHPLTKEEAVELLNSVLKKNGYAVTRNGRILTIVSVDNVKTADLDIVTGSNPEEVEKSDEVVTQIIPVRHANAAQLRDNLLVLLPTSATLSVNESANSLILVATKTDIRRMLRVVTALDSSIASVSSIKVFPLQYADAKQLATVVQQLFAVQSSGNAMNARAQFFNMMRGGGPGGPGGMSSGGSSGGGNAAGARVVAAADETSNSLIVSAAADLMDTITKMVQEIDVPQSDITELRVFHLLNADPVELADQFTQLFPDETRSNSGDRGSRFRFNNGGRFGGSSSTGTSDRLKKKTQVLAVPDQRTSSLLVSAAAEMMPQIADMIAQLDSSPAKKEKVAVYDLQNADPNDVYQILQDLFNRNTTMRNSSANRSGSMLGQNNPLTQRATQQQRNTTSGTGSSVRRSSN
jgi:general secretion pathway protein D